MTIDRGRKNREMKDLLAPHTNLSLVLTPRDLAPLDLLSALVKHHKTMEAKVERCSSTAAATDVESSEKAAWRSSERGSFPATLAR